MKKNYLSLFIAIFFSCYYANAQSWQWEQTAIRVTHSGMINAQAVDAAGNVYVTGSFIGDSIGLGLSYTSSITLYNPSYPLSNASGGMPEIFFVAKYDAQGNIIWADCPKKIPKNQPSAGYSIAVDNAGNVVVGGYIFSDSLSLGAVTVRTNTYGHYFVAKYTTTGTVDWINLSKKGKPTVTPSHYYDDQNIITDNNGDIYLTVTNDRGDTVAFDNIIQPGFHCGCTNNSIYLFKIRSSGNAQWSKVIRSRTMSIDANNNFYVTGGFEDTITFGSTTLHSNGLQDLYIAKFNSAGNPIWARSGGGTGNSGTSGLYIISNQKNSLYILATTDVSDQMTFGTLSGFVSGNWFLLKYDTNGNPELIKPIALNGSVKNPWVRYYDKGSLLILGAYSSNTLSFGAQTISNTTSYNTFFATFDSLATPLNLINIGGLNGAIACSGANEDAAGNIYISGYAQSCSYIYFDSIHISAMGSVGNDNFYVAKYAFSPLGISDIDNPAESLKFYPNPSSDYVNIKISSTTYKIIISDIFGQKVLEANSFNAPLNIGSLNSGIYVISVYNDQNLNISSSKFIKQ